MTNFVSITSWQIDREKMETVTDFIFLGSKITADSDCSHESKGDWQESDDKTRQCVENQNPYSQRLWSSQWSHMVVRAGP